MSNTTGSGPKSMINYGKGWMPCKTTWRKPGEAPKNDIDINGLGRAIAVALAPFLNRGEDIAPKPIRPKRRTKKGRP